jgi:hypothetical protein
MKIEYLSLRQPILFLLICYSVQAANIDYYVGPIAVGTGSGTSYENRADYLNTSTSTTLSPFWTMVKTAANSGSYTSVTVNFADGDYNRGNTYSMYLRNLGNVSCPIILTGMNPTGTYIRGGTNVNVDLTLWDCRNIMPAKNGTGRMWVDDVRISAYKNSPKPLGDIIGDNGIVDYADISAFAECWLTTQGSTGWNSDCDISPQPAGDSKIDFADFAELAYNWLR